MATLNLKDGRRTEVWRRLKARLLADPVYDLAEVRLVFFDGDPESINDLDGHPGAVLQFLPTAGTMSWQDEASVSGALLVSVEARLVGLDVEDIFNLQEALESTLDSLGDCKLQDDLVKAGALTGLVLFNQPLRPKPGPPGGDNSFRLAGQFVVEVRIPLN